jgi:hypothetical protein
MARQERPLQDAGRPRRLQMVHHHPGKRKPSPDEIDREASGDEPPEAAPADVVGGHSFCHPRLARVLRDSGFCAEDTLPEVGR